MVRLLCFVLVLCATHSFAQLPDSFVIRYYKGFTPFSSGNYDINEVTKFIKSNDTHFLITSHYELRKSFDSASRKSRVDSNQISVRKLIVSEEVARRLLSNLNESKDNYSTDYVKRHLTTIRKKDVLKVTKDFNMVWCCGDMDRAELKETLRRLNASDNLDSFLKRNRPDLNIDQVVVDAWDGFTISVFYGWDIVEYRGRFFELFGQPVSRYNTRDYSSRRKILNLEINESIMDLLPRRSRLRTALNLNSLKQRYIKWYLDRPRSLKKTII